MRIYGYPSDSDAEEPWQMKEVAFQATVSELKAVSVFIAWAADELEKHGSDFGHEHLKFECPDFGEDDPDVIVVGSV